MVYGTLILHSSNLCVLCLLCVLCVLCDCAAVSSFILHYALGRPTASKSQKIFSKIYQTLGNYIGLIIDSQTPRRGNEQLAQEALGNQRQKYTRHDGAKALLHTDM